MQFYGLEYLGGLRNSVASRIFAEIMQLEKK